jgi:hypothetical protein
MYVIDIIQNWPFKNISNPWRTTANFSSKDKFVCIGSKLGSQKRAQCTFTCTNISTSDVRTVCHS